MVTIQKQYFICAISQYCLYRLVSSCTGMVCPSPLRPGARTDPATTETGRVGAAGWANLGCWAMVAAVMVMVAWTNCIKPK